MVWAKDNTIFHYKHYDFNFSIINFSYVCSNIPTSPTFGVYISQLILFGIVCLTYDQFSNRCSLLTNKLMPQRFLQSRLQTTTLFDKRDDFEFVIVNYPFLCTFISLSNAYGVYISQLI
jgi:hypothetical protein